MKIIANGITNLTDARYFAAMGVDWMGFSMDANSPLSIAHVRTFADWVEGPRFYLDVRGRTLDEIAGMLAEIEVAGLLTTANLTVPNYVGKIITTYEDIKNLVDYSETVIYTQDEWLKTHTDNTSIEAEEVWVAIRSVDELIAIQSKMDQVSGIVVSGQHEDKIGLKSYEDIDEIIDGVRG